MLWRTIPWKDSIKAKFLPIQRTHVTPLSSSRCIALPAAPVVIGPLDQPLLKEISLELSPPPHISPRP